MAPTFLVYSLHIVITCIMFTKAKAFSLPMIPIDSPELKIIPESLTTQDRLQFLVNISMARALSYGTTKDSNSTTNSIKSKVYSLPSNYYVTQLFFGESIHHRLSPYLLLDTADTKTWMQCDGCNPCFQLKNGGIKAQQSPSYRMLNPNDPRCSPKLIIGHACGYQSIYGRTISSSGPMGTDTFIFLNSQTQQPELFPNLAFGCGMHNENIEWGENTGPNNMIAGVFGLLPGRQSFINQLDAIIQGQFSYCLTSWVEPHQGMSTIYFGASAQIVGSNVKHIAMDAKHIYHLHFRGISVNGQRVPFHSSLCDLNISKGVISKGFIIDSGTPHTALPESVYLPLRAAIVSYFARYQWKPFVREPFDVCYSSWPQSGQSFPIVSFHFMGVGIRAREVDWVLSNENMFVKYEGGNDGFCMAVSKVPDPGPCLFGAYQQANFRVLYDVKNWVVSFMPERCQ